MGFRSLPAARMDSILPLRFSPHNSFSPPYPLAGGPAWQALTVTSPPTTQFRQATRAFYTAARL